MKRRQALALQAGLPALLSLLLLSTGAEAQQALGDSAWVEGDFHTARIAYERELDLNPDSPRANFRLGILASWDGRLDSALVLIRRARAVEPRDPDLLVGEARVLAWDGRYDEAILKYDSALVFSPGHHEALLGRATTLAWDNQLERADSSYRAMLAKDPRDIEAANGRALVLAWRGDLLSAIHSYRTILRRDPGNVRAMIGLARAYLWRGRPHLAEMYVTRARTADPANPDLRRLERTILATLHPRVEFTAGFSKDSDENLAYWQTGTLSSYLSGGLSGFFTIGALEASDPVRDASRIVIEGGANWARGNFQISGALGARRLNPDSGPGRTEPTYRVGLSYRFLPRAGAGISYAHYPFDETALLIGRDLDLDVVETTADVEITNNLLLGVGGGHAWLSDDNTRTWGIAALTQTIRRDFFVGVMGRRLTYSRTVAGYFSPDRFTLFEGRAGYSHEGPRWIARLAGGLGTQQIGEDADIQTVWHAEARFGRIWNIVNRAEIFGELTNSAASSTTGAFRYGRAGVVVMIGL